ncbi:hypothetical protein AMTRI_Chr13g91220 [Amborella trichopoda]
MFLMYPHHHLVYPNSCNHPLTFLDVFWFPISPVQRIFFYNPLEQETNFSDLVDKLKNSLSMINYKDGVGFAFYVAETEADYKVLVTNCVDDTTIFKLLVPPLSALFPASMVSVQAARFPNGGLCIGVSFNHGAAWAEVCRSRGLSSHPNHDRSVLPDPGRLSKWYIDWYKISKEGVGFGLEFPKMNDGIARLKRQVTSSKDNVLAVPSTFAAVSVHIWVCTVRVRNLGDDSILVYVFPAAFRSQLKPKVTEQYFGNSEAMVWAAEAIGNVIRKGRADPLGDAKTWLSWFTELVGSWYLLMAGSPRISICEMGFGWGRLRRVEVVSIDKEGGIALAVAREEEGGVEVSLSLRSSEMHELESLFFKGLNEA